MRIHSNSQEKMPIILLNCNYICYIIIDATIFNIISMGPSRCVVEISRRRLLKGTRRDFARRGDRSMEGNRDRIHEIIQSHGCESSQLIAILQDVQAEYNYLSEEALSLIAEELGISAAKAYSVATFYENFSLEPKGTHTIRVCAGTACHVRKSQPIYDAVHDYLGLTGKKKTSTDGLFTLETVACLGACGLAPVMTVDGAVHAKMDPEKALRLLDNLRAEEAAK